MNQLPHKYEEGAASNYIKQREHLKRRGISLNDKDKDLALKSAFGNNYQSLVKQSLEDSLIVAISANADQAKLTNMSPITNAKNIQHEFEVLESIGDYENSAQPLVSENVEFNQGEYERKVVQLKAIKNARQVPFVSTTQNNIADPVEVERDNSIMSITLALEYQSLNGDADTSPFVNDSYAKQIKKNSPKNEFDLRGDLNSEKGINLLEDITAHLFEHGATGKKFTIQMPMSIGSAFTKYHREFQRSFGHYSNNEGINDGYYGFVANGLSTQFGLIHTQGALGGGNVFYKTKGKVQQSLKKGKANPNNPTKPTTVKIKARSAGSGETSHFLTKDAGSYHYTVHSVNANGLISDATAGDAAGAVTAGQVVEIEIVSSDANVTGFIICRSKKDATDGSDTREMVRIKKTSNSFKYADTNSDLPGTAESLILELNEKNPIFELAKLIDIQELELAMVTDAYRFMHILYATPILKIPKRGAVIKNIIPPALDWYK